MWLLIDNYDSFTYILADYLKQVYEEVVVIKNDELTITQIQQLSTARIILSPGPKSPTEAGITMDVISTFHHTIPILGVCLGHQALAQFFGANIIRAPYPIHGKTSKIKHNGEGIFQDIPTPTSVMRYHSLIVEKESLSDMQILATTVEEDIIMAIQHAHFPCVGLQFHPESILTPAGKQMLANWANTPY